MKERCGGIIYEATKEGLVNFLCQLHRLREEGKPCVQLEEQAFRQLEEIIDREGGDRLHGLRREIKRMMPIDVNLDPLMEEKRVP